VCTCVFRAFDAYWRASVSFQPRSSSRIGII
jgi:hypothetical protein